MLTDPLNHDAYVLSHLVAERLLRSTGRSVPPGAVEELERWLQEYDDEAGLRMVRIGVELLREGHPETWNSPDGAFDPDEDDLTALLACAVGLSKKLGKEDVAHG